MPHHHIFLCRGPNCSPLERGEAVWQFLKKRLKELKMDEPEPLVCRSKVDCFRVCESKGPVVLVYPEGARYHHVDEAKMERIIQSHCVEGKLLDKEVFEIKALK